MSWLFSQALVEEYSAANCSAGEPCAQLNVMPTQHKFWRNDKTMEFSNLSRFGLTCAVLTESRGEALLTWFLAGFPAKTLAQPVKAQELPAQGQDSGKSLPGLLAKYDPDTHSLKTAQCSLFEDLKPCSVTLPRWGSMRSGVLYQRSNADLPTFDNDCGLLPTPRKSGQSKAFTAYVRKDYKGNLEEFLGKIGFAGQINPAWSENLMGWIHGWTDILPLEMDKFQSWLQQHGASLPNGSNDEQ